MSCATDKRKRLHFWLAQMSLSSWVYTKTQTVAVKTANPGVKSHWWKDTWQKPVRAGTRPRWCSSLLRPESRCSRAQLSDRPQSQPLWNLPATETLESSAMLRAKRGIVKFTYTPYIQHGARNIMKNVWLKSYDPTWGTGRVLFT